MITYNIVVRSIKLTSEGSDTVEYVLGSWNLPEELTIEDAMHGLAQGMHLIADTIDRKIEEA